MATRFYFDTTTPSVSPAADGSWEVTGSMVRRWLAQSKINALPGHALENLAVATALNSPAGAVDALILQAVSPQLDVNQTISLAISGQIRAFESNAAADERMQCVIWVMKTDGTSRGTLIATNAAALSNEFNTSTRNIKIPLNGSTVPTTVNALATDRIVVEIGYRKHENATTSRTGTFSSGNPSTTNVGVTYTDLPVDETTTTVTTVGWIEFADNLTFSIAPARVTQLDMETAVLIDSAKARVTQLDMETAVAIDTAKARVSQLVIQTAVSGAVVVTDFERVQVIWLG